MVKKDTASEVNEPDSQEFTEAAVFSNDQHVRTYSKEIHGETFHDLAKEFAGSRGYEIRAH